jgi:hypothetical protein
LTTLARTERRTMIFLSIIRMITVFRNLADINIYWNFMHKCIVASHKGQAQHIN